MVSISGLVRFLEENKVPLLGIVVFNFIFQTIYWTFPFLWFVVLFTFPVNAFFFAVAGFLAVRQRKCKLGEAGKAGAFVALAAGIIMLLTAAPIFLMIGTPLDVFFIGMFGDSAIAYISSFIASTVLICLWTLLSMAVNFGVSYLGGMVASKLS